MTRNCKQNCASARLPTRTGCTSQLETLRLGSESRRKRTSSPPEVLTSDAGHPRAKRVQVSTHAETSKLVPLGRFNAVAEDVRFNWAAAGEGVWTSS